MKIIVHRGTDYLNKENENKPESILKFISLGYNCEIDLRVIDNKLYLGHDLPQYEIDSGFIIDNYKNLFIHCKNFNAIRYLKDWEDKYSEIFFHYFTHENDKYHLTSLNKVLTNDTQYLNNHTIYISPELFGHPFNKLDKSIKDKLWAIMTKNPFAY